MIQKRKPTKQGDCKGTNHTTQSGIHAEYILIFTIINLKVANVFLPGNKTGSMQHHTSSASEAASHDEIHFSSILNGHTSSFPPPEKISNP